MAGVPGRAEPWPGELGPGKCQSDAWAPGPEEEAAGGGKEGSGARFFLLSSPPPLLHFVSANTPLFEEQMTQNLLLQVKSRSWSFTKGKINRLIPRQTCRSPHLTTCSSCCCWCPPFYFVAHDTTLVNIYEYREVNLLWRLSSWPRPFCPY